MKWSFLIQFVSYIIVCNFLKKCLFTSKRSPLGADQPNQSRKGSEKALEVIDRAPLMRGCTMLQKEADESNLLLQVHPPEVSLILEVLHPGMSVQGKFEAVPYPDNFATIRHHLSMSPFEVIVLRQWPVQDYVILEAEGEHFVKFTRKQRAKGQQLFFFCGRGHYELDCNQYDWSIIRLRKSRGLNSDEKFKCTARFTAKIGEKWGMK